jgi:hypothetical protein
MAELRGVNERIRGIRTRRRTIGGLLALIGLASVLSSSPAAAQSDPERGYATQPFTPKSFRMPDGAGCGGDVARWKAVQDNDYASGNIGLKVYHEIQGEIARADAACQAGRDGEARGMIHASKRRHGYPD